MESFMNSVPRPLSKSTEHEKRLREICFATEEMSLTSLGSAAEGLNANSVAERTKEFGPNVLVGQQPPHFLLEIFERVKSPLVIQLLVIMTVSLIVSPEDIRTPIVLGGMILLSVFLAYFQEKRSTQAADNLKKLIQATTNVIREGKEVEIRMSEIVPGDIVVLAAGSIIPADLRVLSAKDFFVSQSALTGESMPVEKYHQHDPSKTEIFDQLNACFQGSTVVSGSARGLIVNTGMNTFLGSIAKNLAAPNEETDFDVGVKKFVWLMIQFMAVMVTITFLIVGLTKHDWVEALLFGMSIAVGLTPEMLPMIITVCLSKGAMFMSGKKVIVKKLKSIQNLGAMDILCTDKTGTLTQDKVILEKHVDITNRPSVDVLRYAYMNSYYQTGLRNLLDLSVLSHDDLDVEKSAQKVDEIPFDFQRKRMSVVIDYDNDHVLICKGSVEAVFQACDKYQIDDEIYPLIDIVKHDIMEEYVNLSSQGYRVLAIAYREYPKTQNIFSVKDESGLIMLGYLAFLDPPKESAERAIASLKEHGVRVKILTGDNELVTRKVCHDVGLEFDRVITGKDLTNLAPDEFTRTALEFDVFAHLTPDQKEAIIKALRAAGHVVGFMGDGINDAAAMKAADVGISVDTAVDVAKEAADIILLEKSLLVLEDGIIEGRKTFNNIIKYIKMGASSNFGNMFSVIGGSYLLPFLPMQPIQILVNNLLYDISQTGIPLDNVDPEFSTKPQSWDIGFIRRFMVCIGPISSIFDYATFGLMWFYFGCSAWVGADAATKDYLMKLFNTGWFVESLLTQTMIVHIIRTNRIPFFQSTASLPMILTTLVVMATATILPYSPVASYLGMVPLPLSFWPVMVGYLLAYSILTHLVKTWFNRRYGVTSI
jgi:Mg2+-importing ATPase